VIQFPLTRERYYAYRDIFQADYCGPGKVFPNRNGMFYDAFHYWMRTEHNATNDIEFLQFKTEQELVLFLLKCPA